MTAAYCITTDAAYFLPALYAAASIRRQPDGGDLEIFILCGPGEAPADHAALDARAGSRATLITADVDAVATDAPTTGFSRAVYRRLFLDRILPERITRIISLDADIEVIRPGLSALATIDLGGHALAAAFDMIFLKQFGGGALGERFVHHRAGLGLGPDTPYFNNGVTVIDRAAWSARGLGAAALRHVLAHRAACPYLEQDGLNAVIAGDFAPLSPRFNFMGDFFHLDLEGAIAPIVRHFVTRPKPWETVPWQGRYDIPAAYDAFFEAVGSRPDIAGAPEPLTPQTDVDWPRFRARLLDWASRQRFADRAEAALA
ncbi:glycosyltransferase family 8 protein [Labrys monachus]|uniref:Lipopolysaccharide biosynthesis glycosyltransferase n=1 Tax=Labrys monachus TaxID=217067 RepID=A0ABU0FN48_9HYPH|nr:glycosyltransferase [Labrys monachus]MDQ0396037.1 lipopolysaccharide biosynthesis glycosyltransferase [Labrys monachus]